MRLVRAFRPRAGDALLTLAVVIVAASVWTLVASNRTLRHRVQTMEEQRGVSLAIGDPIPAVRVSDRDGKPVLLSNLVSAGTPAIIAFLAPDCGYCDDMMPFWGEAADRAKREGIPFLGVLLAAERPPSPSGAEWPLYAAETAMERRILAIPVVPFTVVVDRTGAVTRSWRGAQPMRVIADVLGAAGAAVEQH